MARSSILPPLGSAGPAEPAAPEKQRDSIRPARARLPWAWRPMAPPSPRGPDSTVRVELAAWRMLE
ncbi:MAG: hypothetical protein RBU30_10795, partial [Polyangia bacterium]|nr:hypothetical protein [Polyangia bacterium]